MHVLVTAASRHGATAGIAEAVGDELRARGFEVSELPPDRIETLRNVDAVVLGSGVYAGRWLEPARSFVTRHREALALLPVWLFSSGPVGDPAKPQGDPSEVAEITAAIGARGHRVFAGRIDRHELGFAERAIVRVVGASEGDFRDWDGIRAWADEIAGALRPAGEPISA